MPVQQRLCTGAQLVEAESLIRGRNRRRLIQVLVHDIADGAHSLGELDVVAACRRRGLPEPTRQVVRRLPNGRAYLDIAWKEARLVVEVDGAGHAQGVQVIGDDLRQNEVQLGDELVLRVSLIGWRLVPEAYLDQICAAYWSRAYRRW
jgi:very-short-patch-repair endonuclease